MLENTCSIVKPKNPQTRPYKGLAVPSAGALPALEGRLDDQVEEVDDLYVRIAREQVEHLLVPARLIGLAGELARHAPCARRAQLGARVPGLAGGAGLDAGLVEADRRAATR